MSRRTPLTPIFDYRYRRGSINVGNSPGVTPPPPPPVPVSLSFVGRVTSSTQLNGAYALAPYGDYVVATATLAPRGLTVIDVSTPASPSIVGNVQNSNLNSGHAVATAGSYAVVTCGENLGRFTVVDLSTPASPSVAGTTTDSSNFFTPNVGVATIGTNAFVTAPARLGTLSIATPSSPAFTNVASDATNYASGSGSTPVIAHGSLLYVGATNRLVVVDVSTPTAPSVVNSLVDSTIFGNPDGLSINGSTLLALDLTNRKLTSVDISAPASPLVISTVDLAPHTTGVRDVRFVGSTAAVVLGALDVLLVDVSDPSSMSVVDSYPDDGFTNNPWRICTISTPDMFAISSTGDDTVSVLQVNY